MNINDVIQNNEIFKIAYDTRPTKSKMSADTTGVFLYLLSQKAACPKIDFQYSGNPVLFYKDTFNSLEPIVNNKLLANIEPAPKISIRGAVANTLYAKPNLALDIKAAGILEIELPPISTTKYTSEFNYAKGVVSRFIMALQVHCEVSGMFIGDISTPLLKSYGEKAIKNSDWSMYRDPNNFSKLYLFVPKEILSVASKHCSASVSQVPPSHLLEKCTPVRDIFVPKVVTDIPDNIW